MSQTPRKTLQVRVETLPAVYAALVKALTESELSSAILHEVVSKHVSAACVSCGIEIKGDALNLMTLARQAGDIADGRLARLKQGYCCRRSCDSYYYKLAFAPHPAVNWDTIVDRIADAEAQLPARNPAEETHRSEANPALRMLMIKVAAGVGLVLVLLLVRHLLSGGSLPGFSRTPKYTVDPASLPTVPGR